MTWRDEYACGMDARLDGLPLIANPHVWHSTSWYAWQFGWQEAAPAEDDLTKPPTGHLMDLPSDDQTAGQSSAEPLLEK